MRLVDGAGIGVQQITQAAWEPSRDVGGSDGMPSVRHALGDAPP